jgi:hypothetical protein
MKLRAALVAVLTALASMAAPAAPAAPVRAADVQLVVLAFTLSYEGPKVVRQRSAGLATTTFVRKDFSVERFSNREFLLDLLDEHIIADIRGWSLVRLSDPRRGDLGFFIIKFGALPIDVNSRLALTRVTAPITSFVSLRVVRGNSSELTRTNVLREIASLRISSGPDQILAQGVLTSASNFHNGLLTSDGSEFASVSGFALPRLRFPLPDLPTPILDAAIVEGLASLTRARSFSGALR